MASSVAERLGDSDVEVEVGEPIEVVFVVGVPGGPAFASGLELVALVLDLPEAVCWAAMVSR